MQHVMTAEERCARYEMALRAIIVVGTPQSVSIARVALDVPVYVKEVR